MLTTTEQSPPAPPRQRLACCLACSLGLHVLLAGALALGSWQLAVPRPDITWLDLENRLGAPQRRQNERPKKKQPPAPAKKAPTRQTPRRPPAKAHHQQAALAHPAPYAGSPQASRPQEPASLQAGTSPESLAELAPGDAALMLLIRQDRLRSSPYEAGVRRLLHVFYDYKTILWSSGVDPIADLDALLIATPNPYRVTQTFLAAKHRLTVGQMKAALTQAASFGRQRLRWSRRQGALVGQIPSPPKLAADPRQLYLEGQLVLLSDPQLLGLLDATTSTGGPDAGVPPPSWRQRLDLLPSTGGDAELGPGLLLYAVNLPRLVRLPADLPVPRTFSATISPLEPADLEGSFVFDTAAEAQRFTGALPRRLEQAQRSLLLRLLGVTDLLRAIQLRQDGERVLITAQLSGDQVRGLLELTSRMIPQVPVPDMPDRLPPDAGPPSAPDAGADKGSAHRPGPGVDAGPAPPRQATETDASLAKPARLFPDAGGLPDAGPPNHLQTR